MLRLSKLGPGREGYYLQAVAIESPGQWMGHGTEQAGLTSNQGTGAVRPARGPRPDLGRGARFRSEPCEGDRLRSHLRRTEVGEPPPRPRRRARR